MTAIQELLFPAAPPIRRGLAPERDQRPGRRDGLPRNAPTSSRCPGPGCRIWVPMPRLACAAHWSSLPASLRRQLDATYRRDPRRHLDLFREAVRLLHVNALREDPR